MSLWSGIKDPVVTICALGGFILGVLNFAKAWRRDRRELAHAIRKGRRNLLRAEYRKGLTDTKRIADDLYVVNSDPRPITDVHIDFYESGRCVASRDRASLSPKEAVLIHQFGRGAQRYESASFAYTDEDGNTHVYDQKLM